MCRPAPTPFQTLVVRLSLKVSPPNFPGVLLRTTRMLVPIPKFSAINCTIAVGFIPRTKPQCVHFLSSDASALSKARISGIRNHAPILDWLFLGLSSLPRGMAVVVATRADGPSECAEASGRDKDLAFLQMDPIILSIRPRSFALRAGAPSHSLNAAHHEQTYRRNSRARFARAVDDVASTIRATPRSTAKLYFFRFSGVGSIRTFFPWRVRRWPRKSIGLPGSKMRGSFGRRCPAGCALRALHKAKVIDTASLSDLPIATDGVSEKPPRKRDGTPRYLERSRSGGTPPPTPGLLAWCTTIATRAP
jgi:hypothetical protein